jgi:hypothetical protein
MRFSRRGREVTDGTEPVDDALDQEWRDPGEAEPEGAEAPVPPRWLQPVMVVLAAVWLLAGGVLFLQIVGDLLSRAGQLALPLTGGTEWLGQSEAQRHAVYYVVVGAGLPAIGLLLALRWRRGVAVALFGGGAALCLLCGIGMYALVTPDGPPTREDRPPVCQERSGGGNDCPGG